MDLAPSAQTLHRGVRRLSEPFDGLCELMETLVRLAVLPCGIASENTLEDDRELPVAQGHVEVDLREVAAGELGVARADQIPGGKAGGARRRLGQRRELVAGLRPVDEQQ